MDVRLYAVNAQDLLAWDARVGSSSVGPTFVRFSQHV